MKKLSLLLSFMILGTVIFSGCISNNVSVKQSKFEYQIEGYNTSFLFDTTGYQISKEDTTYGKGSIFEGTYYKNGINISSKDGSKGVKVDIKKYIEPQKADVNNSEVLLRLGFGLSAIQGAQFNRSIIDGHEALILFLPSQELMGRKIPNAWEAQYYLDNKTIVSFTAYGLSKTDFEMIRDSFQAKKANKILDGKSDNAVSGSDLYTVKVKSTGEWTGSVSAGNNVKSAFGPGDKTFTIQGSPLTATFKKNDENSILKVEVWNGDVLKESGNTTAPYGIVTVKED